jgi:uncharacterized protein YjbI with pentapeptide repeats
LRRFEGVQADNVDVEKMFARSTQWIDCDMQWKGCCDLNGARFERCCIVGWNTAKSEKADEYIECKLFDWVVKSADYGVGNFLRSEISRFEIYCELGTCRQCQMSELIVEKGGSLNLTECTLRKSRFAPGAKLAHLDATVVEDCTLGRATIRGDCKGTRFVRSDLRGAHFEGSAVAAEFEDCRLQGATYPKGTKFSRGFDPKKHGMRAR